MASVFNHLRHDPQQLTHLVAHGLRIFTEQQLTTITTTQGLHIYNPVYFLR